VNRRVVLLLSTLTSAGLAAGCSGILGLDQTHVGTEDAAASDASPDTSTSDVTTPDVTTTDVVPSPEAAADAGFDAGEAAVVDAGHDAPTATFTASPDPILLTPDASMSVQIAVQRNGALPGAISVTFTQLPTGVTSTTGTIGADAGTATVTVSASASAPVESAMADLTANGAAYAQVTVDVSGAPGSIDSTFQGGYVTDKETSTSGASFSSVAIDAKGGIIAGGTLSAGGWMLRRYDTTGIADTVFDTAAASAMPSGTGSLRGLAIDPTSGNIVCVGTNTSATNPQMEIVVLDSAGNAAGSFNGGLPYQITPVTSQTSTGAGVAIVGSGTFFVAGANSPSPNAVIAGPFSETGIPASDPFISTVGTSGTSFNGVALDVNGSFVAASSIPQSGSPAGLLGARYTSAGVLDSKFGDAGFATTPGFACGDRGVAVRPKSGNVFACGSDVSVDQGCFGEWTPTGSLVYATHGTSGGGGAFIYAAATAMPGDSQDRLYMVGSGGDMFARSAELDRVLPGGTYDKTFGGGQVQLVPNGSPPPYYFNLQAVAVQADGRIVIAGSRTDTTVGTYPILGRFWP
jgi:hypothetical protein